MVVRELRINRAYQDQGVRLAEHPDPDEGKKKRALTLEGCDDAGPIFAAPLRYVCSKGDGVPSYAGASGRGIGLQSGPHRFRFLHVCPRPFA